MSRTIKFYWNKTDKRYLNKSITQQGNDVTGVHFIDETELINPVIKLSSFDESKVNYMYIPDLDRYYFLNNVKYSQGFYLVSWHVDVLMSFKNSILSQEVILKRASEENHYNLYQSDDKFQLYEYTNVRYKFFKEGQTFSPSIQNFVLCVMGGDEIESEE